MLEASLSYEFQLRRDYTESKAWSQRRNKLLLYSQALFINRVSLGNPESPGTHVGTILYARPASSSQQSSCSSILSAEITGMCYHTQQERLGL